MVVEEEEVVVVVFGSVLFPTRGEAKMRSQIDKGVRIFMHFQNFTIRFGRELVCMFWLARLLPQLPVAKA